MQNVIRICSMTRDLYARGLTLKNKSGRSTQWPPKHPPATLSCEYLMLFTFEIGNIMPSVIHHSVSYILQTSMQVKQFSKRL